MDCPYCGFDDVYLETLDVYFYNPDNEFESVDEVIYLKCNICGNEEFIY